MSVIPSYLAHLVVEGQGTEHTDREIALCQVEAIEAQTAVLERIATVLEGENEEAIRLAKACNTALGCCQAGDVEAAAHVLHSALGGGR